MNWLMLIPASLALLALYLVVLAIAAGWWLVDVAWILIHATAYALGWVIR